MTFPLGYHTVVKRAEGRIEGRAVRCPVKCPMQRPIPASLALFGMLLLPLLLVSTSPAQINAATSSGSAHSASVTSSSIVSPVRSTSAPSKSDITLSTKPPHPPKAPNGNNPNNNGGSQPHTVNSTAYYPYVYLVPVPYTVDASGSDASDDNNSDSNSDNDPEYQGGPPIFDRRGSGAASYVPTSPAEASAEAAETEDAPAPYSNLDPEPQQAPTILVFKDGHQLEVANYAIVSQTLYDLTPGRPRKIALSDLDLPATEKQNDDHGIVFQLPPSAQAN
jgi:hypothetical protein